MSFWSKFPFARFALCLILGVCSAYNWRISQNLACCSLIIGLCVYVGVQLFLIKRNFIKYNFLLGISACIGISSAGCLLYTYENLSTDVATIHDIDAYKAVAIEDIHERPKSRLVSIHITAVRSDGHWEACNPIKARLYMSKTTTDKIEYGDTILVKGSPKQIQNLQNNEQSDANKFVKIPQVYYTCFTKPDTYALLQKYEGLSPYRLVYKLLRYSKTIFAEVLDNKSAYAVVCALILGDKDSLENTIRNLYIESGTMHVLAVSGLHVGAFYFLLTWVLALFRLNRRAMLIGEATCIGVLWFYAAFTGFSASVLRATIMFSIVGIGRIIDKKTVIYNTLGISSFILILLSPKILFDVGFQLSYLAVLGIAHMADKIYKIVDFKSPILDKLWNLSAVSLAAQISTTPISLFYFCKFPVYFIFANWVVVPVSTVILYIGLAILSVGNFGIFAPIFGVILEKVVLTVNSFLEIITKLPYHIIDDLYLSFYDVFFMYIIIISFLIFAHNKKFYWLCFTFLVTILYTSSSIYYLFVR